MWINFLVLLLFICLSRCMITCPSSTWKTYKKMSLEGSWLFVIPDKNQMNASFYIKRVISYRCSNSTNLELSKGYILNTKLSPMSFFYDLHPINTGFCYHQCDSKNVSVKVWYRTREILSFLSWPFEFTEWSEYKQFGNFFYLNKNCDKLYWTAWTEMSNCSTLHQLIYTRQCVDCDGDAMNATFCDGDELNSIDCHHFWSEWVAMGQCNVTGCNSTGNRIRKRQCLYGKGIEATNAQLCSTYLNESDAMLEQCNNTNLALNCTQSTSNTLNFIGFYVGIGVVATLIFALFISVTVFKHFRHKTDQSTSNDTTNQIDQNFSPYEVATESPSTRQGNNANERIQTTESNVFFQKNETLMHVYESIEPRKPEFYTQIMRNGVKSIISTDYKNQQPIENGIPLYSTVQDSMKKQSKLMFTVFRQAK